MELENKNEQREFRSLLDRAYCWSSPIKIDDRALISNILFGMNVFDICLALEEYGFDALQEALTFSIETQSIPEEYRTIIEIQIKASQEYLNGFNSR